MADAEKASSLLPVISLAPVLISAKPKKERTMSKFTPEEVAYLQSQRYGRLATVDQKGELHVVPVTFRYHPLTESIHIGGEDLVGTKKYRDALSHGRVAFVVDDVLPPMRMRMVEVRGTVEGLPVGGKELRESFASEILHITPTRIISFGLSESAQPDQAKAPAFSRKVG
jgi:pyridoxamine 5'-phosphate oxidase family protein